MRPVGEVLLMLFLAGYAAVGIAVGWSLHGMWDERRDGDG